MDEIDHLAELESYCPDTDTFDEVVISALRALDKRITALESVSHPSLAEVSCLKVESGVHCRMIDDLFLDWRNLCFRVLALEKDNKAGAEEIEKLEGKPDPDPVTLRDLFAGCALIASAAGWGFNGYRDSSDRIWNDNKEAESAYQMADAMLKARGG